MNSNLEMLQEIADGIKRRHAPVAAMQQATPPADDPSYEDLKRALSDELREFDSRYQYSDDYGYWAQQAAKARRINDLRMRLAKIEGLL
jgi:hypothetical protein